MVRRLLLLSGLFLVSGCSWAVRQETDRTVCDLVDHPFDMAPERPMETGKPTSEAPQRDSTSSSPRSGEKAAPEPEVQTDVQTTAWMDAPHDPDRRGGSFQDGSVRTVAWTETQAEPNGPVATPENLDLNIPPVLPGSEAPRIELPEDRAAARQAIQRLHPALPPLPVEPPVLPGPEGKPLSLADLQRLAAANSPALRQAAADVEAAKGSLIQAKTYSNPIFSYLIDPTNNNSTAGVQGIAIEQVVRTGGKQKLGVAAAQQDLNNAILALKRARYDLSTAVRNAYFTLLVDKETLVVTRALARVTDDIYRLQTGLLRGTLVAPYEPTALRAQAFTTRLAYKQAIASYLYDWKTLVATIGLLQFPLTEIAGQVDRFIPYYDYDQVLAYTLQNHTDILATRNVLAKARFNLKLAQVTPLVPDLDVRATLEKDFTLLPFGMYNAVSVGIPLPIWDQNKGNIIAAQAALVRASEESHRVEVTLTSSLAAAYSNYKNNLSALEYYRRFILPDLVRYYRGIFARRQLEPTASFGDLVFAQQNLAANVTSYLGVLGSLWTSVVSVADFLQTDDLFQMAKPHALPELPDWNQLALLPCGHSALAASCAHRAGVSGPAPAAPGAGMPLPLPAGGVPPGPAGSGTGTPPPAAGAGGAPPLPLPGAGPPGAQGPTDPTNRPPAPTSGAERNGIARLERRGALNVGPAAPAQ
jgi:cobalt-zinc-cadmium efflux system outer membrane protein